MKGGLFFERLKTQRGEWPTLLQRDFFPKHLRNQVWFLWNEVMEPELEEASHAIVRRMRYSIGVGELNNKGIDYFGSSIDELKYFLLNGILNIDEKTNANYMLSALEMMCLFLQNRSSKKIDEVNYRLRLAGVGYKFIGDALVPTDDENLTDSAVLPAISLLNQPEFAPAYAYVVQSFVDYRSGTEKSLETAIDNIQKATEALLKIIFDAMGIAYNKKDTYMPLVLKAKENNLFPDIAKDKLNPLMNNLQALGGIRNYGGGHGTPEEKRATDRLVRLAIHHAMSNMLYIAETYLEQKCSNT